MQHFFLLICGSLHDLVLLIPVKTSVVYPRIFPARISHKVHIEAVPPDQGYEVRDRKSRKHILKWVEDFEGAQRADTDLGAVAAKSSWEMWAGAESFPGMKVKSL